MVTLGVMETRSCRRCGTSKPVDQFTRHARYRSGYEATCRACHAERQRARYLALAARPDVSAAASKRCPRCETTKAAVEFPKRRSSPDGLGAYCSACNRGQCLWYATQHAGAARARSAAWYAANKDRAAERDRARYVADPEAIKAKVRAWRKLNPVRHNSMGAKRRALIALTPNPVTQAEAYAILDRAAGRCTYCGVSGRRMTLDHIVALTRGGMHVASNLAACCVNCNSTKRNRPVESFLAALVGVTLDEMRRLMHGPKQASGCA